MQQDSDIEIIGDGKYLQMCKRGTWEMVFRKNMTGIVGMLAMTDDDEILLIEQYRPPLQTQVIELPAGLVGDEPGAEGESFESAARRELLEETGYEAAHLRLICSGVSSPGMTDEAVTYYLATGLTKIGEPEGDGHEDITVHVVPRKALLTFLQTKQEEGAVIDLKMFAPLVYVESENK